MTKKITRSELIRRLTETDSSSSFISIDAETVPSMRKTGNPFHGSVMKRSTTSGIINFHYSNAVNNQREREGNEEVFVSKPRTWGTRIEKSPLVEHKGSFYIEMKVEDVSTSEFFNTETGDSVAKDQLLEWLPKSRTGVSENQGTDKAIFIRDYKVNSITGIRMYGEDFEVIDG